MMKKRMRLSVFGRWSFGSVFPILMVIFWAAAMAQDAPKPGAHASTQAPAKYQGPKANEQPLLSDDEKKDLTILNQAMVIQQQRFQLLQAEMAKTQQEYARLAGERDERLARAKRDHKWGEDVSCNADALVCAKAPAPKKK